MERMCYRYTPALIFLEIYDLELKCDTFYSSEILNKEVSAFP